MLIPSIDLMGGRIVQLVQGEKLKLAFDDFEYWIDRFSSYPLVQLIDLDAAMRKGDNRPLIEQITHRLQCQIGGGVRSPDQARTLLDLGAKRVIFGSVLFRANLEHPVDVEAASGIADAIGSEAFVASIDTKGGKVASHLVKYAHHADGEAHFSQDGKVKTDIRRKAVPLAEQSGHLFTIQTQDFASFPALQNAKERQLTFNIPDDVFALRLTVWRFRLSDMSINGDIPAGAIPVIRTSDGVDRAGLMVLPPEGARFDDVALFLTVRPMPPISEDLAAHLIFLGGFDSMSVALNHAKDTELLAFAYPCADFAALKRNIGSIDFIPGPKKS